MERLFANATVSNSTTLGKLKEKGCTFGVIQKEGYKVVRIINADGQVALATTAKNFEGNIGLATNVIEGANADGEVRYYLTNNSAQFEKLELA